MEPLVNIWMKRGAVAALVLAAFVAALQRFAGA